MFLIQNRVSSAHPTVLCSVPSSSSITSTTSSSTVSATFSVASCTLKSCLKQPPNNTTTDNNDNTIDNTDNNDIDHIDIPTVTTKHVRFSSAVLNSVHVYPAVPRERHGDCFYSRSQQKRFLKQQTELARRYVQQKPYLVDCVYLLHGYERKKSQSGGSSERVTVVDTKDATPHHDDNDNDVPSRQNSINLTVERARTILAESDGRGLEPFMTPLLYDHRIWAIQKLLRIQQYCRSQSEQLLLGESTRRSHLDNNNNNNNNNNNMAVEQIPAVLAFWSLRVAAVPGIFAHQMALGDEQAARQ